MNHLETYRAGLRTTLRRTAAAYGYTLTIATTAAELTTTRGAPSTADLFLFVGGGLVAFAALDLVVAVVPPATEDPDRAFPFAGALNFVAVAAGLGAATLINHGVRGELAWFMCSMAATATYLLLVAAQVAAVDRLSR